MKKYIPYTLAAFITLIIPLSFGFAQEIGFQNPSKFGSVPEVLLAFFKILVQLGAVAVTLSIIYAGFLFVMARGNPEQLKTAKTTLFWTIIGAMILLGAQVIANVIENTVKKL